MSNDENVYRVLTSRAPVAKAAQPAGPEWTSLQQRVAAIEDDPHVLAALEDVDTTGDAGTVLVKQPDGTYAFGSVAESLEVDNGGTGTRFGPVTLISWRSGIEVTPHTTYPYIAIVKPLYGTSANTVAEGNHAHSIRADVSLPFDSTGTLSSGTRELTSGVISGLTTTNTYIITASLQGDLRGEGTGAGSTLPSIVLNGNTRYRFGGTRGEVRTVAGVDRPYGMAHPGVTVTGVSSISVSASLQYRSGDPINVGAGDLVVTIKSNR